MAQFKFINFSLILALAGFAYVPKTGAAEQCSSILVSSLPSTNYHSEVRTESDGSKHVWIIAPTRGEGSQGHSFDMGTLSVIPAGTAFFHWGSKARIASILNSKSVNDADLASSILLSDTVLNAFGGGFYVSKDAVDSSQFGVDGVVMTLTADLSVIHVTEETETEFRALDKRINYVIALREAGYNAIQEYRRPNWFNFILPDTLHDLKPLDMKNSQAFLRQQKPVVQLADIFIMDQKIKGGVQAADLSDSLAVPFQKILRGQELTADEENLVVQSIDLNYMNIGPLVQSSGFVQTPLFKALDKVYQAHGGKTLEQTFGS